MSQDKNALPQEMDTAFVRQGVIQILNANRCHISALQVEMVTDCVNQGVIKILNVHQARNA